MCSSVGLLIGLNIDVGMLEVIFMVFAENGTPKQSSSPQQAMAKMYEDCSRPYIID